MFAIAFDLTVADILTNHPSRNPAPAYTEIKNTLGRFGFVPVQGSVYVTNKDDLANLFSAIMALKMLPWFPLVVKDIRAFKIEHWSDFTGFVKS